jgi:5-methylcytosine-specific restriction endonuclease McrA
MTTETALQKKRRLNLEAVRRYRKRTVLYWRKNPAVRKAAARRHYLKHKDRLKPIRKAWMLKNKSKWTEYYSKWCKENAVRCIGYSRNWMKRNPERARQVWQRWNKAHPEKRKQVGAAYRTRHPETAVRNNTIRRLRVGDFDRYQPLIDSMIREVSKLPFAVCTYCQKKIDGMFHIDHIVPVSRGGKHVRENLCVACKRCNLSKGPKLLTEWKGGIYAG